VERKILWSGLLLLVVFLGVALVVSRNNQLQFSGVEISPAPDAPEFSGLYSSQNGSVRLEDFKGKLVLLFFGYTNCPDVCPATVAKLKQVISRLDDNSDDVAVLMVTTDPKRDTPEQLNNYLENFNPDFVGLTGNPSDLQSAWDDYGVAVLDDGTTHSARVYVIDREGKLRLTFPFEMTVDDMISDLKLLVGENQ
jgi:protein SCO1